MASIKRKIRFVTGVGTLLTQNTDYWLEPTAIVRAGAPTILGVILHGVWEPIAGDGIVRRYTAEARLRDIVHTYKGQKGLLETALQSDGTWAGAGSYSLANVRLDEVSIEQGSNNAGIEYVLTFSVPVDGFDIARSLSFTGGGSKTISAVLLVQKGADADRTTFKPVFRAGLVRIADGPLLHITRVIVTRTAVAGATDLLKRQASEAEFLAWARTHKGNEGTLTIDGTGLGTHHLRDVAASDLSLLGECAYELEFVSNYGS